jgi:predicted nucleic acid-binding protein
MDPVQVLDTGVLLAIVVSQDQHHEKCLNYVTSSDSESYMPPAAKNEFKSKLQNIQDRLSREIKRHRKQVIREYSKPNLDRTDLVNIRENVLEPD